MLSPSAFASPSINPGQSLAVVLDFTVGFALTLGLAVTLGALNLPTNYPITRLPDYPIGVLNYQIAVFEVPSCRS